MTRPLHPLLAWWIAATDAAGRGITALEAWDAWRVDHPDALRARFLGTVRHHTSRGSLVAIEGGFGNTRLAHKDHLLPPRGDLDDPRETVYDILVWIHAKAEIDLDGPAEVRVRDLLVVLRDADSTWTDKRVTNLLGSLSASHRHGPDEWRAQRVERRRAVGLNGIATLWWRPVGADVPDRSARPRLRGRRDAMVTAVDIVRTALRCPPDRTDLEWWIASHANSDPVAARLAEHSASQSLAMAAQDRGDRPTDHTKRPPRCSQTRRSTTLAAQLVTVRGPQTCWGGATVRYAPRDMRYALESSASARPPISDDERVTCRVHDACYLFRPAEELLSLATLQAHFRDRSATWLVGLVETRRALLSGCVADLVGDTDLAAAARGAADSLHVLRTWVSQDARSTPATRRSRLRVLEARLRACATLGTLQPSTRPMIAAVGTAGLVPFDSLAPFRTVVGALLDRASVTFGDVFPQARRCPAPSSGVPMGRPDKHPQPWIDRVDALLDAHAVAGLPSAQALLASAETLLGSVVRDAVFLRRLHSVLSMSDGMARRGVVVALGLLGAPLPFQDAVPDPSRVLDVEAFLLASALGEPETALGAAKVAYRLARDGRVRRVADDAIARLQSGDILGVIG
jgi:hypothetical protein